MARRSRKKNTPAASAKRSGSFGQKLESWIKTHARQVLIASLALNFLTCLALFDPKPHTGGDNASYIILAESVLRTGDGYSDNITPGPPKPHTQYGFGYPLLLSPLVWLFGRNVVILKLFSVVLAVGSVAHFSVLLERLLPPLACAGLTLAAALNPVIVDYSHWILSEIAFLFFSLLSLYLLLRSEYPDSKNELENGSGWAFYPWLSPPISVLSAWVLRSRASPTTACAVPGKGCWFLPWLSLFCSLPG